MSAERVTVRILYLPRVQVTMDAEVALKHGLQAGVPAVLPRVTEAMETQWVKDHSEGAHETHEKHES